MVLPGNCVAARQHANLHELAHVFEQDTGIAAIGDVTHDAIVQWRDAVIQRAALTAWNSYRRGMKTVFNFAVRRGWLAENHFLGVMPLTLVKRKKTVSKRVLAEVIAPLKGDDPPVMPGGFG